MSTLIDLDEFTEKVIGTFKKYRDQHPGDEVRTFETWIGLFIDWTRYEDGGPEVESGGPTSPSHDELPKCPCDDNLNQEDCPDCMNPDNTEPWTIFPIGEWDGGEVQPPTGVKSSSDEPTNAISEKPCLPKGHWDEVPLDWEPEQSPIHRTLRGELLDEDGEPGWPVD